MSLYVHFFIVGIFPFSHCVRVFKRCDLGYAWKPFWVQHFFNSKWSYKWWYCPRLRLLPHLERPISMVLQTFSHVRNVAIYSISRLYLDRSHQVYAISLFFFLLSEFSFGSFFVDAQHHSYWVNSCMCVWHFMWKISHLFMKERERMEFIYLYNCVQWMMSHWIGDILKLCESLNVTDFVYLCEFSYSETGSCHLYAKVSHHAHIPSYVHHTYNTVMAFVSDGAFFCVPFCLDIQCVSFTHINIAKMSIAKNVLRALKNYIHRINSHAVLPMTAKQNTDFKYA